MKVMGPWPFGINSAWWSVETLPLVFQHEIYCMELGAMGSNGLSEKLDGVCYWTVIYS